VYACIVQCVRIYCMLKELKEECVRMYCMSK